MKPGDVVQVLGRHGSHYLKYKSKHVSIVSQDGTEYKVMTNAVQEM